MYIEISEEKTLAIASKAVYCNNAETVAIAFKVINDLAVNLENSETVAVASKVIDYFNS